MLNISEEREKLKFLQKNFFTTKLIKEIVSGWKSIFSCNEILCVKRDTMTRYNGLGYCFRN